MKRSFVLQNIKPFSINATYYGNGRIKTSEAREWEMNIFYRLSTPENEEKFSELRAAFDSSKHALSVLIVAYYPEVQFYTKKGNISNKIVLDMSNGEKLLLDCMMLSKHALKESPQGCQNLQIDDKELVNMLSFKRPTKSGEPRIEVTFQIVNKAICDEPILINFQTPIMVED